MLTPPAAKMTFQAVCDGCDWKGRDRQTSLRAVQDFDRHVQTVDHVERSLLELAANDDDDLFGEPDEDVPID